jgi:hypothetical protein
MRTHTLLTTTALLAVVLYTMAPGLRAADPLTPAEARTIAKEAFLWGMHPIAIYHLRFNQAQHEQSPKFVGVNRLSWYRQPITAADRFATTPNATTLYGTAMLDLSQEPVVLTVPAITDHYWSIQFAARFYGPLIDGSYNMPGVVRVE